MTDEKNPGEAGAVADVAAKLTEAQRKALLQRKADYRAFDSYWSLRDLGLLVAPKWKLPFLTPLGLAVRQHLEQGATAGVAEMNEQMFGQGD